ncbi:hypothetical protein AX774_g2802, partial [Zancudomyces culisetae]
MLMLGAERLWPAAAAVAGCPFPPASCEFNPGLLPLVGKTVALTRALA